MTGFRIVALVPLLMPFAAVAAPPAQDAAAIALSRAAATRFQQELGGALVSAIEAQGTAGAVTACASIAPAVAEQISTQSGASVRRTALRNRNPLAAPDAYEHRVMTELAKAPLDAEGKPAEAAGWTGTGTTRRFRYMRAIPTAPMCLSCHGSAIAPDVAAAIAATFPADKATGFAAGDMRGAFSISWTVEALRAALAKP